MERAERAERFAKIWWKSRADMGKSQEYMALALGVSKKTIANWEKGLSSPTFFQGTEWFNALGVNPMPYYYEYLIPETKDIDGSVEDEKLESILDEVIRHLPIGQKRQLLYVLYGNHGSSPIAIMQMVTAHLQCPSRTD